MHLFHDALVSFAERRVIKMKICFAASSGGHYEQLMMLKPLMEEYNSFVITEKTLYNAKAKDEKVYYMITMLFAIRMITGKRINFMQRQ